jgi:plasmid stabilization system protein ParE
MAFPVRFTEEAEKDLINAATWFAGEVGIDLADRFIDLIESTIQQLAENPEHYAVVHKNYRQCVIRPFSYIVTYRIKSHSIEILAVTHGSRDPKVWMQR